MKIKLIKIDANGGTTKDSIEGFAAYPPTPGKNFLISIDFNGKKRDFMTEVVSKNLGNYEFSTVSGLKYRIVPLDLPKKLMMN